MVDRYKGQTGSTLEEETKNVFSQGIDAMVQSEERGEKPIKLFGLIEVPAGAAMFGKIGYNALSKLGSEQLQQPIYEGTQKLLGRYLSEGKATKGAAAATIVASMGLKAGGYVVPFFTTIVDQHKENRSLAKEIAPVLDEIKGNHSELAFMMVNASDNSVIAAHKHRMDKVYGSKRMAQITDVVFNAGMNILLDVKQGRAMWKHGMSPEHIEMGMHLPQQAPVADLEANPYRQFEAARAARKEKSKEMLEYLWTSGGAGLSEIFTAQSRRKQKEVEQKPSAFEMIVALDQQVGHNPNARVQPPGEHRDYSLEAYIMKVMLTHQKEMAAMDSHYTEIRPALREDLAELVTPIAEAIRGGKISALTLMHLVGEPKKFPLIRNKGRALATADEVEGMIEKLVGKKSNARIVNVDDFLAQHNLDLENLKKALGHLNGEDRLKITALFPDSVLEKAGVGPEELKRIQDFRASPAYDTLVASLTSALAQTDEKALKHDGLTTAQIKRLDGAAERIQSDQAAVSELKTGLTNPDGIEHDIIDWAMHKVQGGQAMHFGTVVSRGAGLLNRADVQPLERSFMKRDAEQKESHAAEALQEIAGEFDEPKGGHAERQSRRDQRRGYEDFGREF